MFFSSSFFWLAFLGRLCLTTLEGIDNSRSFFKGTWVILRYFSWRCGKNTFPTKNCMRLILAKGDAIRIPQSVCFWRVDVLYKICFSKWYLQFTQYLMYLIYCIYIYIFEYCESNLLRVYIYILDSRFPQRVLEILNPESLQAFANALDHAS